MRYTINRRRRRYYFSTLSAAQTAAQVIFERTGIIVGIERESV